jgi:hypothetical protein
LVHEKITGLLESEDEQVKKLALEAIYLAQTRHLSAEVLATKLYQQLNRILKVQETENEH